MFSKNISNNDLEFTTTFGAQLTTGAVTNSFLFILYHSRVLL